MNNFPAMTEAQRQELAEVARNEIKVWDDGGHYKELLQIALAALTADTSKLAELAAKVRKVREDAADFDGDRRGMWEYQEEQEQLLLEEAVKYTAPPAPVLKPIELPKNTWKPCDCIDCVIAYDRDDVIAAIRAAGYEVKQ